MQILAGNGKWNARMRSLKTSQKRFDVSMPTQRRISSHDVPMEHKACQAHASCRSYHRNKKVAIMKFRNDGDKSGANYMSLWRARWRKLALQKYGGRCVCCGERNENSLTFDHINNDGAAERTKYRSHTSSWYKRIAQADVRSDIQLLCYTCNCTMPKGSCGPHALRPLSEHWYFNSPEACGSMP